MHLLDRISLILMCACASAHVMPPATSSWISPVPRANVCARQRTAVAAPSASWELDFYSRPVQGPDGKKLWELLVTDDTGSFRHVEVLDALSTMLTPSLLHRMQSHCVTLKSDVMCAMLRWCRPTVSTVGSCEAECSG